MVSFPMVLQLLVKLKEKLKTPDGLSALLVQSLTVN